MARYKALVEGIGHMILTYRRRRGGRKREERGGGVKSYEGRGREEEGGRKRE